MGINVEHYSTFTELKLHSVLNTWFVYICFSGRKNKTIWGQISNETIWGQISNKTITEQNNFFVLTARRYVCLWHKWTGHQRSSTAQETKEKPVHTSFYECLHYERYVAMFAVQQRLKHCKCTSTKLLFSTIFLLHRSYSEINMKLKNK